MATDGTNQSGVFHRELEACGIEAITPSAARQADVMSLIFDDIKAGVAPDMAKFDAVAQELRKNGAQAIILGCTELSVINKDFALGRDDIVDSLEVLAIRSIELCGKTVKG